MTNNKIDFNNFNLENFKEKALSQIKSGQSLINPHCISHWTWFN
jgi:hypothetical protein